MSRDVYPIVEVRPGDRVGDEAMGSKVKFWLVDRTGVSWLFKFARAATGEHWSEKVAAEIALCLGLPAARVELATCDARPGSVSADFRSEGAPLVPGNELLREADESYPKEQLRGVSRHTIEAIFARLSNVEPPTRDQSGLVSAADWFVGYLLLDALIVNTDRHHENWSVLQLSGGVSQLAPSYDHASSLGRELSDAARLHRLSGRDAGCTVSTYLRRARSGIYGASEARRALHPTEAFRIAAQRNPRAREVWLGRLAELDPDMLAAVIAKVPRSMMSTVAGEFALAMLRATRQHLLGP